VLDAELVAPAEEALDVLRAGAVAVVGVGQAHVAGPATVAVDHDADVPGQGLAGQLACEPTLVDPVKQVRDRHNRQL
jgi:hypothetical protein